MKKKKKTDGEGGGKKVKGMIILFPPAKGLGCLSECTFLSTFFSENSKYI